MSRPPWVESPGLSFFCRLVAAGTFLAAGIAKIGDPAGFATQVSRFELFPSLANLFGVFLPWAELVLGTAMLFGVWPRAAALGMCALFALFIPALLWALAKGLKIDCGCFATNEPLTAWTVLRDVLILLPVIQVLTSRSHRWVMAEG